MNRIKSRLFTGVCFFLAIVSSFPASADTWRVLPMDSGRAQWQSDGGYCGALTIQKIMLKYGIWISQQEARSAGGSELLLGENYAQALDNLSINHITYTTSRASASTHLQHIRNALSAGNDYIIGARTNLPWGYYTTYDHIFAVHAVSGSASGYDGNNYIYFNDSNPVAPGTPDLTEKYCTWDEFNGMHNGCDYFFDDIGQWGEQITGVSGWSGQVSLLADLNYEPGESTGSASKMYGSVHITGLNAGNSYTIKKWEGRWQNYDGFSSNLTNLHTFTANTTTYDYRVSWTGGNIAIFNLVDNNDNNSADDSQSWSGQSVGNQEWRYYSFYVPKDTTLLSVETSGGTGDADLYIRHEAHPTTSNYDCKSWRYGNNETCKEINPVAGTWHIGMYGYDAAKDFSVSVEYKQSRR
jgi:hypothetical protein